MSLLVIINETITLLLFCSGFHCNDNPCIRTYEKYLNQKDEVFVTVSVYEGLIASRPLPQRSYIYITAHLVLPRATTFVPNDVKWWTGAIQPAGS